MKKLTALFIYCAFVAYGHLFCYARMSGQNNKTTPLYYEEIKNQQAFDNKVVMLMQFDKNLSGTERAQLKAQGIDLQEYLRTENSYLTVISKDILPQAVEKLNIIQTGVFTTAKKQSQSLREALSEKSFPAHAYRNNGEIKITIRCLKGFNTELIKKFLINLGAEIEYAGEKSRRITLWIEREKVDELVNAPFIVSAEIAAAEPVSEYNRDRSNHRANFLSQDFTGGNTFNGDGIKLMLQDDGVIGPHIDYNGRIYEQFLNSNNGDHGDHCSGILMGAGNKDPLTKGMAWGSEVFVYSANGYQGFDSIYDHYNTRNITISSTSYADGCNAGYTSLAATLDEQIYNMPLLMHVFSAGNNGTQDCNYGAGAGWGNITGGHKHSKNSIAAGNLDNLDNLASSSSRGPVHDGRLKPEVCAGGTSVYSTIDNHSYDTKSGTSMACPGVAGALAMLSEAYRDYHGTLPHSSLLKAMIMNTADDLGNTGPDFKFGYGRINGRKMLQPVSQQQFMTDSVASGQTKVHQVFIPGGLQQARLMICWNDYPAAEAASPALINDLDLSVQSPNGTTHLPLVLNSSPDPALLNLPAISGADHLNNHEQVVLDFPQSGNYQVQISGFDVPFGPQHYSLTWFFEELKELVLTYPNGGETHSTGESITIRWDAAADTQSFALSFTADSGQTWTSINPSVSPQLRNLNFQLPASSNGKKLKVKIERGFSVDQSDASFHVMNIPQDLSFYWICQDSLMLRWDTVSGANAYDIFLLGNKYMDSIATTQADSFILRNINAGNEHYWLSVRARNQDGVYSRRAIAVQSDISAFCPLTYDVALNEIESPAGPYFTCMNISQPEVRISIRNIGLRDVSQIPVFYSIDNGSPLSASFTDTLSFTETGIVSFATNPNISTPGSYSLKVWSAMPGDLNHDNDTLEMLIRMIQHDVVSPAWTENMESFSLCQTAADCGVSVCTLTNGMMNAINGEEDDTDWRVNAGNTPTSGTGPSQDYLPGTVNGKYLYLEASDCDQQEGVLYTPCIDLGTFPSPRLTFSYHMSGGNMGSLNVELFVNGNWINSIFFRNGDQGASWETANISLSAYSGQTIVLRFRGRTNSGELGDMAIDGIMIGNVSGEQEFQKTSLRIIPNPNSGHFNLLPSFDISGKVEIEVFTSDGKCILTQNIKDHPQGAPLSLSLSGISAGLYYISVRKGENISREKLMIQPWKRND